MGAVSGGTAGYISGGQDGALPGAVVGSIIGATTSVSGVKNPKIIAGLSSVSGQMASQVSANHRDKEPLASNLKIDVPVTAGSILGASVVKKPVETLAKEVGFGRKVKSFPYKPKPGQGVNGVGLGNTLGGLLEGVSTGSGEQIFAALADLIEAKGIPTNIELTNSNGEVDISLVMSNRNANK